MASRLAYAHGYIDFLEHRDRSAWRILKLALRFDPQCNIALDPLIELCSIRPASDDRLMTLQRIGTRSGDLKQLCAIGRLLAKSDNINNIKQFVNTIPDSLCSPMLMQEIVQNAIKKGELELAELTISRGLRLFPMLIDSIHWQYYIEALNTYRGKINKINSNLFLDNDHDIVDPDLLLLKGKLFLQYGDTVKAIECFKQTRTYFRETPEAYFQLAQIAFARNDFNAACSLSQRSLYYGNCDPLAFIIETLASTGKYEPITSWVESSKQPIISAKLTTGDSMTINIKFNHVFHPVLGIFKPFGFGIEGHGELQNPTNKNEIHSIVRVTINSYRPSSVNLHQSWVLSVMLLDTVQRTYQNQLISVEVQDVPDTEGRILFVVTEDHETSGDFPHIDMTPKVEEIDYYEARIDLLDKCRIADSIGQMYGVLWSHIIDIGSSFLTIQNMAEQTKLYEWTSLFADLKDYFIQSVAAGNDIQLHIHGYNIPGNILSRQYIASDGYSIQFKNNSTRTVLSSGTHGAWADNFTKTGGFSDSNSRVGSLYKGIRLLEDVLHSTNPTYQTTFFRAGEYEFGNERESICRSIASTRANQILSSSNAYSGTVGQRSFKFHKRIGDNCYFTRRDDINLRANALNQIGTLEIVPVPRRNAADYIQPVDPWTNVTWNYKQCFDGKRIKNNIFINLEMYHLNVANSRLCWNSLDANNGDWKRIMEQFQAIRQNCPRMEKVTISEASKIYLDRYTPDLVALRTKEKQIDEYNYCYEIKLLGTDIPISTSQPHWIVIKPPSFLVGQIDTIALMEDGVVRNKWEKIDTYADLECVVTKRTGYTLAVHLK